jgi:Tfp pilus assembly protein PilP
MKTKEKCFVIIFMMLTLVLSSPEIVFARANAYGNQQTQTDTPPDTSKEASKSKKTGTQKDQKKLELDEDKPPITDVPSEEFLYKPAGRRDPFWDLLRGKSVRIKREEKEGIAGLLIDELELEGILLKKGEYIALFKGPDGKPYDVKVGANVYDGEVIKIDLNYVVFKRLLTIALGGTRERMVTKRLIPEEEAGKK